MNFLKPSVIMQAKNSTAKLAETTFLPKLLTDKSRLQEIYDLRVSAWENSGKTEVINRHFFPNGWSDDLDDAAHHWVITNEQDHIIAAARLNVFNSCDRSGHCAVKRDCNALATGTCGFLGRLVIHPHYQHRSLSAKLIDARLAFCTENKINWMQALVTSEKIKTVLTRLDFKAEGQLEVNYHQFTPPHAVQVFVKECRQLL